MTLPHTPSKNRDKIMAGNRPSCYSTAVKSVRKKVVCGMWDELGPATNAGKKHPRMKELGI